MKVPLPRSVAVIGGGIGGLGAALAMARRGVAVTVHERNAANAPLGGGLQLSPNGCRALAALGVLDAARAIALTPRHLEIRSLESGNLLFCQRLHRSEAAMPYLHLHRAGLRDLLLEAARCSGVEIHYGSMITDELQLCATAERQASFAVAADGVRSRLRGDAGRIIRLPVSAWRGHCGLDVALVPPPPQLWIGAGRHCVTYPVPAPDGGLRLNCVMIADDMSMDDVADDALRRSLRRGVHARLAAILDRLETIGVWPLYDCPSPPPRVHGRVVLLGDAAHPMPPFAAQGAAMALEDGVILAALLGHAEVPALLEHYAYLRAGRVARVRRVARRHGMLFHPSTLGVAACIAMAARFVGHRLPRLAPAIIDAQLRWIYDYDPLAACASTTERIASGSSKTP